MITYHIPGSPYLHYSANHAERFTYDVPVSVYLDKTEFVFHRNITVKTADNQRSVGVMLRNAQPG
jgi:ribosomal protein S18